MSFYLIFFLNLQLLEELNMGGFRADADDGMLIVL